MLRPRAVLRLLFLLCGLLAGGRFALAADEPLHPTGLRPPTVDEQAWMDGNLQVTGEVRFNEIGLRRTNADRAARGLGLLSVAPAAIGQENGPAAGGIHLESVDQVAAATVGGANLPSSVDNSTLDCFPPVGNQGSLSSCASFSTAYYVGTHMTGLARGWNNRSSDTTQKFSPKWVYNFVNGGTDTGSWFSSTIDVLLKLGCATWADFPYDSNFLEWSLNGSVWRNATNCRFAQAGRVQNIDTATGQANAKALLNNGYLILYATDIYGWQYTQFSNDPATTADDALVGRKVCYMMKSSDSGHAMTIVGYNDDVWIDLNKNGVVDAGEKGAFKVVNSWGTSWSVNDASGHLVNVSPDGFAWIAYDALKSVSAVAGADNTGRASGYRTAFWGQEVYWVTARSSYTPAVLAQFTLQHPRRRDLGIKLGESATSTTTPAAYFPVASNFGWQNSAGSAVPFQYLGGAYGLNGIVGSTTAGTFVFDFTDLVQSGAARYYLEVADNSAGSAAQVSSFKLISPTGAVLATATSGIPLTADNTTARAYVDFASGGAAAPVITATTASATVGQTFSYAITASNAPTAYAAAGLPPGLAINATSGAMTGTPTQAGTFTVSLTASNANGTGGATLVITVSPALVALPAVNNATLTASGTVGVPFSTYTITATNSPTSYAATGLPGGLALNAATGAITGTPTASGVFTVALSAANAGGTGASVNLTITISSSASGAPVITSAATASGVSGAAFTYRIQATNTPTSFSAAGLPAGLTLNATTGLITGTLPSARNYSITLGATNAAGSGYATLSLSVTGDSSFAPSNDAFVNSIGLTGTSATAAGANTNATAEPGEPNHAGYAAVKSVWWTWTAPVTGPVTISTAGSTFDTVLAVYTGTAVGSLTAVVSNDDASSGVHTSQVSFTGTAGTTYAIAVDGFQGDSGAVVLGIQQTGSSVGPANDNFGARAVLTGASAATTTTNAGATAETGEPAHAGFAARKSVWWTWTAPSAGTVTLDTIGSTFDTLLAVYTGSTLAGLTSIAFDDQSGGNNTSRLTFHAVAGTAYQIAVDGYNGATGTIQLNLALSTASPPANDNFASRTVLTGATTSLAATNVGSSAESGEPAHAGYSARSSVWWSWTASADGILTVDTIGSAFDTLLAVYTGSTLSTLTPVAFDDDSGGHGTSLAVFAVTAGTTYQIAVDGYGGASGAVHLDVQFSTQLTPANDNFAARTTLTGLSLQASGSNTGASAETGEATHAGQTARKSVWWKWTAPTNGPVIVTTLGSSFDTVLGVYTGSAVATLSLIVANDDANSDHSSKLTFFAIAGTEYEIVVDGYKGASGQIVLNLSQTASDDLYATDFEAFPKGLDGIVGTDGWLQVGETTTGVSGIIQSFPGQGYGGWLGSTPNNGTALLYRPIDYVPPNASQAHVRFTIDFALYNATGATRDYFGFYLYNAANVALGGILFDNVRHEIRRVDAVSAVVASGSYVFGQKATLTVDIDFSTNTWSASYAGSALFTSAQICATSPTPAMSLGELALALITPAGNSVTGTDYILFDNYKLTLLAAPALTNTSPVAAPAGQPFLYKIAATGSPSAYTASGLPPGLVLDPSTGTISGTPTVPGSYNVGVSATNSLGSISGTIAFTIANFPPVITSAATASTRIGLPFTYQITASYSPTAFTATGLPTGFTVNPTGLISGTAQVAGTVSIALGATNAGGTGAATLLLTVLPPPPVLGATDTAHGTINVPFSYAVSATGRVDSYAATGLPAGLTLDPASGMISGAPTASGIFTVQLTATNSGGSATCVLTLTVAAISITTQPLNKTVNAGSGAQLTVAAPGSGLTYQWQLNGANLAGATSATLTLTNVQPGNAGAYQVIISSGGNSLTSAVATLTVVGGTGAPTILSQPASETIAPGSTAVFNVSVAGAVTASAQNLADTRFVPSASAAGYQWQRNGVAIGGATNSRLVIPSASAADAGVYTCVVTNFGVSTVSQEASLAVTATSDPGRLINLSVLSVVQSSLTMGYVIGGSGATGSENVLIRATGPALALPPFNVPGVMVDPTLAVVRQAGSVTLATNSGWGSNAAQVTATDSAVGAFALTDPSSHDSVVVTSLPISTGGYTASVTGTSGYALTEVYDATPAGTYTLTTPRLINLSCLTSITAGGTLTVGFVVGGSTAKTVLVRVSGPTLAAAPFGIGGTMTDPKLSVQPLSSASTILAANTGWGGDAQLASIAAGVGAFAFTSASSLDSAALVTLAAGVPYTVQVNSASGGGGLVLVEIYEVP